MKTLIVFSKFFGWNVGGAERSSLELVKNISQDYDRVIVFRSTSNLFQARSLPLKLPSDWEVVEKTFFCDKKHFHYFQYFLNKKSLLKDLMLLIQSEDQVDIFSYGFFSPMVSNLPVGRITLTVRDEFQAGWNKNYHLGLKGVLKHLLTLLELPFYCYWKKGLRRSLNRADAIIVNSNFIKNEIQKFGEVGNVIVKYPQIDYEELKRTYGRNRFLHANRGLVLIGNNAYKGADLFRKLSKEFPDLSFYIIDRECKEKIREKDNLYLLPWAPDPGMIYAKCLALLVPSVWSEAYGRVAEEAAVLGIPVIVHGVGGLPEAVHRGKKLGGGYVDIVKSIEHVDWREAILKWQAFEKEKGVGSKKRK